MNLQKLLDRHEDAFHEALGDVNKIELSKALDDRDAILVMKLLLDELEPMAESKRDRGTREDDAYERRSEWEESYISKQG